MIESEKLIERKLSTEMKQIGGWSIKLLSSHISGLPDRLCLFPGGRLAFVEVKTTGKKPRPIQWVVIGKIRSMGFDVRVIDSTQQVKEFISQYGRK